MLRRVKDEDITFPVWILEATPARRALGGYPLPSS